MIKVYFHIAAMNYYKQVVNETFDLMRSTELYDAADKIYVNFAHDEHCRIRLPKKAELISRSFLAEYEFPALRMVKKHTEPGDRVLYLHTKGVSRKNDKAKNWRDYLLWGNVERWRENVDALDNHDLSGVLFVNAPFWKNRVGASRFYAGNFWWARGDYIDKLDSPETRANRWAAEGWVMGAEPKTNCLHCITGGKRIKPFTFANVTREDYANG